MAKFIVKGRVKYQGKLYTSGETVEVDKKDVAEFKKHGWQIVGKEEPAPDNEYAGLKVAELKALLTEKGIEFKADAKKEELLALLA